jgi:hypothetical protein
MALHRRTVIVGLTVLGVIALGFEVAALTNPWRLTGLYPLAHEGLAIGIAVFAGALLGGAGLIGTIDADMRWQHGRAVSALAAVLVAIPALCAGLLVVVFGDSFRHENGGEVLAVAPSGDFSAVKSTLDEKGGLRTHIYIRSRAGPFGRESAIPVAECPFDPFSRGVPPESVRFTSDDTLAVPIADKPTVVLRFDPDTLAPERTIDMCDPTSG